VSPRKKKRAPAKSALQITKLKRAYRVLAVLQAPFAFWFWFIEQRKAQIQDQVANERSGG